MSQPPRRAADDRAPARFSIGEWYLDQPHPERGGVWYVCRYDAAARRVRRKSLRTTDFEEAKREVGILVAAAPARAGSAPDPGCVMTSAVLMSYLSGRATQIRTEEYARRACELALEYLEHKGAIGAPVSAWTPARQMNFAEWLHRTHGHAASTIKRIFSVLSAAVADAATTKIRVDAFGQEVEGALISHAPAFAWGEASIGEALGLPAGKVQAFVPSVDEMSLFIDSLRTEHLRRWALLALATWARPEAVADFDPYRQWDRRTNVIDLDPGGRRQTNKRRPRIVCCRTLAAALDEWMRPRAFDRDKRYPIETIDRPPLLIYKRQRVKCVKRAVRRIAADVGLPGLTQRTMRTFMATTVRKLCGNVAREKRSAWLGHTVREGSRTTRHYEVTDPEYLSDVALATDYVLQLVRSKCKGEPFAAELRMTRAECRALGAKPTLTACARSKRPKVSQPERRTGDSGTRTPS